MNTCEFEECDREVRARGLCSAHYQQQRRGGELKPLRIPSEQRPNNTFCKTCQTQRTRDEFYLRTNGSLQTECRPCMMARSRRNAKVRQEKLRELKERLPASRIEPDSTSITEA